jgi:hypothetical protein
MNTTDLETACRESAAIGDASAYPDYTQARMLRELTDKMRTVFEDIVTKSRSGYWLHEKVLTTTVGKNRYRIPPRAVVGGLESVEISASSGGAFYPIDQIPVTDVQTWEGTPGRQGQPLVYTVIGDQVELIPTPSSVISVKFTYYIRPSTLVPQQSTTIGGGTIRGLITNVNTGARTVSVAVLPFDQSLSAPAAITSGLQTIDIVHPNGWHELSMVDAPQTVSGVGPFTITLGGTDSMEDIEVGDFVRVSDQTDWPCLPDDFHRPLADIAAVKILIELHLGEKAAILGENVSNDVSRFRSLLYPRVKAAPKQVGIVRRARGAGFPYGRTFG